MGQSDLDVRDPESLHPRLWVHHILRISFEALGPTMSTSDSVLIRVCLAINHEEAHAVSFLYL